MTQMARLFRALADPNRLRIVNILSERSACVCDLQSVLGLSQPFVSRHLACLRRTGLVRQRREGPRVCYSLAADSPAVRALRAFLGQVQPTSETFQADLKLLASLEKSGKIKSLGLQIMSNPAGGAFSPREEDLGDEDSNARAA